MSGYLMQANAKKGTLIFNIFRTIESWGFMSCTELLLLLLILEIIQTINLIAVTIAILPICICGLLVVPMPNYHNVLCALGSIYRFYTEKRRYAWKGWCFYEQFESNNTKA